MDQFKKTKLITFFALLGGGIFLIIALTAFSKYQSSFLAVIMEKRSDSGNSSVEKTKKTITYALNFTEYFLLSDVFIEQVEKEISSDMANISARNEFSTVGKKEDFNKKEWKINKKEWRQSLTVKKNKEAGLVFVKICSNDPKINYLHSLETARGLKEYLPEFINAEGLEIKILNSPTRAIPNYADFIYFSILGVIAGGLTGTTFLMLFREKATDWIDNNLDLKWKWKRKKDKKKKPKIESVAYPKKNTTIEKERVSETLNDEKIKERLNRLINGEF